MRLGIAMVLVVFGLVGCGGTTVHPKSAPSAAPDYHIEFVPYNGHTLVCLIKHVAWGGPSCDWTSYHHKYGWSN